MTRGTRSIQHNLPDAKAVGPETPLRLKVAAAIAYPDGSMTASGLRKEAARGRLVIERTAGKDYTTLQAIEEMRKLCRHYPGVRDCGSERQGAISGDGSLTQQSGSSSTQSIKRAQSAAQTIVTGLKERSKLTSTANTSRRPKKASVILIKSPLPTC
jgi:hypothetical protein